LTIAACLGNVNAAGLDLTGFGEGGYRLTNFYKEHYGFYGGWTENRLALRNLVTLGDGVGASTYAKIVLALTDHRELPEENVFSYGLGIELRLLPFNKTNGIGLMASWLSQVRLYAEYLKAEFLRREVGTWVPRSDWRFGAELWKEVNNEVGGRVIYPSSLSDRIWAELWSDIDWKSSSFFRRDFKSWNTAIVLRVGIWYPRIIFTRDIYLSPYFVADHASSQWKFAWQNRALAGAGIRILLFPHSLSLWLRRLKFFAECVCIICYYDEKAVSGTPNYDFRIGVNFSNSWR
jgi:hypothetical protein